jgi:hypothetical protein
MVASSCVLAVCVALIALPALNPHKSAKEFCGPLRHLSENGVKYDLYSLGFSRAEYIYYSKHFHERILGNALQTQWVQSPGGDERAELQATLSRTLPKTAQRTPALSLSLVAEKRNHGVQEAVDQNTAIHNGQNQPHQGFPAVVVEILDRLFDAIGEDLPAFIIVQERHWRWACALCPVARGLEVLADDNVGSRHVLLVGNKGATKLFYRYNGSAATRSTVRL